MFTLFFSGLFPAVKTIWSIYGIYKAKRLYNVCKDTPTQYCVRPVIQPKISLHRLHSKMTKQSNCGRVTHRNIRKTKDTPTKWIKMKNLGWRIEHSLNMWNQYFCHFQFPLNVELILRCNALEFSTKAKEIVRNFHRKSYYVSTYKPKLRCVTWLMMRNTYQYPKKHMQYFPEFHIFIIIDNY